MTLHFQRYPVMPCPLFFLAQYSFVAIGFTFDKMNVEHSQYVHYLLPITSYGTPSGPAILAFSASLPSILFRSTGLVSTRHGSVGRGNGE